MIKLIALLTTIVFSISLLSLFRSIYVEFTFPNWDRQAQKRKMRWRACWMGSMCLGVLLLVFVVYLRIVTPITGG